MKRAVDRVGLLVVGAAFVVALLHYRTTLHLIARRGADLAQPWLLAMLPQ